MRYMQAKTSPPWTMKYSLQHTATHCSALQHTATHCNTLQYSATHCTTLHHTAPHCTTLHHTAPHCTTLWLQHTACTTLHHTAPHRDCNTLQHKHVDIATHCDVRTRSGIMVRQVYLWTLSPAHSYIHTKISQELTLIALDTHVHSCFCLCPGWQRTNLITGLSVLNGPNYPLRTQKIIPDRCRPSLWPTSRWVKTMFMGRYASHTTLYLWRLAKIISHKLVGRLRMF